MKILFVEDDHAIAEYVARGLREAGHSVDHLADGRDALTYCLYGSPDVAIIDRMMPGMDGLSVVKALRATGNDLPVLLLTALGSVDDKVAGLEGGADDYLVKPFHFSELIARIAALTRRRKDLVEATSLEVHDLKLDLLARVATRQGTIIDLQSKEFALLEFLMRNAGRIVTRTMLLEQVWDLSFEPNTTVVETHMSRLRAKVDRPFDTPLIHTVRNSGYSIHGPR